jgi:hypothetical protein
MAEKALFVDFCFHRIDSFLQRLLLYMPRADCCTEFHPLKVPTKPRKFGIQRMKMKTV